MCSAIMEKNFAIFEKTSLSFFAVLDEYLLKQRVNYRFLASFCVPSSVTKRPIHVPHGANLILIIVQKINFRDIDEIPYV